MATLGMTLTTGKLQDSLKSAGLADSTISDRAWLMVSDQRRVKRMALHRRWVKITSVLGLIFLAASLTALKFEFAQTQKAEEFATLVAVFGLLLFTTGMFVGWHSSATERQLHRLAMLRLNLDSFEATAEVMRTRARLALAEMQCMELGAGVRGECAIEMLSILRYLEEREQGALAEDELQQKVNRLVSLGVREEVLECLINGSQQLLRKSNCI